MKGKNPQNKNEEVDFINNSQVKTTYAVYSTNEPERFKSSSGGVFSLLAKEVLADYGVVYGVAMSADCKSAEFIRATDEVGLNRLRTSKYLQAHIGKAFVQVKKDLNDGLTVLFTGTGCQVNGLIGFLGGDKNADTVKKKYPKLYCIDVICHGVPSPALWREYVRYVEKCNGARLVEVNFRCKDVSWTNFRMKETDDKHKEIYASSGKDPYIFMFQHDYCLRPSCYECKAKEIKLSDITIGDFWGIEKVAPEMTDGKGTSLVLIRTDKGKELFDKISDKSVMKEVSCSDGVACNPCEYKSVSRPPQRDIFFEDMYTFTFEKLKEKYGTPTPISLKSKIKTYIKKVLIKLKVYKRGVKAVRNNVDYCMCFVLYKGSD